MFRLVRELSRDGIDVTVACRMLNNSRSGYYAWASRPPSMRDWDDAQLLDEIYEVHAASRATYGAPRVHGELKLGRGRRCVARFDRTAPSVGYRHSAADNGARPLPSEPGVFAMITRTEPAVRSLRRLRTHGAKKSRGRICRG